MQKYISQLLILILLTNFISCQKENQNIDQNPDDNTEIYEPRYEQYGTPFANVPDIQDIVLYEVNLRAFSESGDLQGVIDRIDDIQELGVNVIWLMPIHPIGEINSVNSPYSVKDYKAVGSEYGTITDLRKLTDEAHSRGIAVIMDWVANHTAWDNEWITNTDWYTQDADGNIIHPEGTNWLDVADLNYNNKTMRDTMIDAMLYWVFTANIDGFRCDHADGVPYFFWQDALETINEIPNRDFIFFAEGSRNDHFDAGFDMNFSWDFYEAVKSVYSGQSVSKIFTAHYNEYPGTSTHKNWVRFTTNHDESAWDATPISLFNGIDGALAASAVTIFTGGIPLIYGSQEVGTANTISFFTNSTINWDNNPAMKLAYSKMLQFYVNVQASRTGENTIYQHDDIACFKKVIDNEEIVIIANLRNSEINFEIPSELNNSEWIDIVTETNIILQDQLTIEPYQFFIMTPSLEIGSSIH